MYREVLPAGWERMGVVIGSWGEIDDILAEGGSKVFASYRKDRWKKVMYVSEEETYNLLMRMLDRRMVEELVFVSIDNDTFNLFLKEFLKDNSNELSCFV